MSQDVTEVPSTRNSDLCDDVVPRRYISQRSRDLVASALTEEVENKTHKTKNIGAAKRHPKVLGTALSSHHLSDSNSLYMSYLGR
jgi:hypothetical protein